MAALSSVELYEAQGSIVRRIEDFPPRTQERIRRGIANYFSRWPR